MHERRGVLPVLLPCYVCPRPAPTTRETSLKHWALTPPLTSAAALAISDTYLLVPNAIGAVLATSQLFLCVIFRGGAKTA